MISFDSKGNIKPYRPIISTVDELEENFVVGIKSVTRKENFDKYIKYSNDLKKVLQVDQLRQWVNGSFVTKKINPKDIDLVTFVDSKLLHNLKDKVNAFRPEEAWSIYGVDAYLVEVHPVGSKGRKYTDSDTLYWLDLFGSTRTNRKGQKFKKGFLEIIY